MAVYFFYGDEDFNIESEISKLRSKLNQDFISMSYQVLDNPDYKSLIQALRTPPMMFGEMLIVVNADSYFAGNKNAFEDSELEDIKNALDNNPQGLNIIFTVVLPRGENKKLDSRRKLYKILSNYNKKEYRFATYLGATVKKLGDNSVTVKQGCMELEATLIEPSSFGLNAPCNGSMVRTIRESTSCIASYRFRIKGKTVFAFKTNRASFEYEY